MIVVAVKVLLLLSMIPMCCYVFPNAYFLMPIITYPNLNVHCTFMRLPRRHMDFVCTFSNVCLLGRSTKKTKIFLSSNFVAFSKLEKFTEFMSNHLQVLSNIPRVLTHFASKSNFFTLWKQQKTSFPGFRSTANDCFSKYSKQFWVWNFYKYLRPSISKSFFTNVQSGAVHSTSKFL